MIRRFRMWMAQRILPQGLTTADTDQQTKLVNALRDALREKDRLADVAARVEAELAELKKR